jgi:hypothetical protein
MSEQPSTPPALPITPAEASVKEIRRLLHDMNNALEIILQTSYLLGTLELGEDGREWHRMLEQGVHQAATLNRELREEIRKSQDPATNN